MTTMMMIMMMMCAGRRCRQPGLYPNTQSCHAYYICVRHRDRWYKFHMKCPRGLGFRRDTAACGRLDDCPADVSTEWSTDSSWLVLIVFCTCVLLPCCIQRVSCQRLNSGWIGGCSGVTTSEAPSGKHFRRPPTPTRNVSFLKNDGLNCCAVIRHGQDRVWQAFC